MCTFDGMDKMQIVVKFPTRSRPKRFLEYLKHAVENQQTDDVFYLITIDVDDATMTNDVCEKAFDITKKIKFIRDVSMSKIHACNRDMEHAPDFDILVLMSDDMKCVRNAWDVMLQNRMSSLYPDTDGVLWHSDGHVHDRLNTMCILGRKYYDRFGYIYHPDYKSLWCDNEFMDVANILKRQSYSDVVLFEHTHPANTGMGNDSLYNINERFYTVDRETYTKRKAKNFDLE